MNRLILPHALSPGATIGICSPSGPVARDKLETAASAIDKRGYRVFLSPSVFDRIGYLAGNDETRLFALCDMFERPDVDAVFASRGGYGASRILARVDCGRIAASRKPFVGFSDVTALQWFLLARAKFVSFSGPLAVEWAGGVAEESLEFLLRLLSGRVAGNLLTGFPSDGWKVLRAGRCDGALLPGNLTLIASLFGTRFLPVLEGAILAVEEVGEPRYRLDRLLFHLRNAGVFDRIGGLIVGDMTHGAPMEEGLPSLEQIVLEATAGFDFPILFGVPYGHGPVRVTLPVGIHARLDVEKGELILLEPAVEEKSA